MKPALRVIAASILSYGLVYALLYAYMRTSSAADPHASLRDPSRCTACHMEDRPEAGRPYRMMTFRKDIYTLCTGCHPAPVTHPVDIAPRLGIAGKLPLDADGTMTCVTCHAPHRAAHASVSFTGRTLVEKVRDTVFPFLPGRFRTCFLRVRNTEGELCKFCHASGAISSRPPSRAVDPAGYAGSAACAPCHPGEFAEWKRSPHARMVRSPLKDPGAVIAAFDGKSPFPRSEIAYVLGSRAVQRFVSHKGDSLVVRTPIWIVRTRSWNLDYWREQDWGKNCAGCHLTGYDPALPGFAEEGIGCEACHGPGRRHVRSANRVDIVHPGRLQASRRAMICEACHTTGHDATGEYRFPVGFLPGGNLSNYFFGLVPKPGQDDSTFRGDESAVDRHGQFRFWSSRILIAEGETCDLCKNFRSMPAGIGPDVEPEKMSSSEYCRSCHGGPVLPTPPHHGEARASRDGECLSCHPVTLSRSGNPSVHDHKYLPEGALRKNDFPPSPDFRSICFVCHPAPKKGA